MPESVIAVKEKKEWEMYLMGSLSSIHMEENWIEKPIIISTLNFLKLTRKNTFSDSCKKLSKKVSYATKLVAEKVKETVQDLIQ